MAHAVSESATFDASIEVPDTGDDGLAESVSVPIASLANRTKYLKTYTDQIAGGLSLIRYVGNLAALAALVAPTTYTICIVPIYGTYMYIGSASLTADGCSIVESTDTASTYWVRIGYQQDNTDGGFPVIGPSHNALGTPSGKIAASLIQGRLKAALSLTSGIQTINDVILASVSRPVTFGVLPVGTYETGDRVISNCSFYCVNASATEPASIAIKATTSAGSVPIDGAVIPAGFAGYVPINIYYLVPAGGPWAITFDLYATAASDGALTVKSSGGNKVGNLEIFAS